VKVRAIYHREIMDEDGVNDRTVHSVDHDGGGFVVSSEVVGIAVQNFLNKATTTDIRMLHSHLLTAFKDVWQEESMLPVGEQPSDV
jgi:hypothetical protein